MATMESHSSAASNGSAEDIADRAAKKAIAHELQKFVHKKEYEIDKLFRGWSSSKAATCT